MHSISRKIPDLACNIFEISNNISQPINTWLYLSPLSSRRFDQHWVQSLGSQHPSWSLG